MRDTAVKDVQLFTAAGVALERGQPLVAGTTYYAELGGGDAPWSSIQWKWDDQIIITSITVESSNLDAVDPLADAAGFYGGVRSWDAAADGWYAEPSIAVVVVAGGTAGNEVVQFAGSAAKRHRAEIVVGGTGGALRGRTHHKS